MLQDSLQRAELGESPRREEIATHIVARLQDNLATMHQPYTFPGRVPSCWVDDLLPDALARRIFASFPTVGE